jgi:Bacterial PH domain/Short C-terminal domain
MLPATIIPVSPDIGAANRKTVRKSGQDGLRGRRVTVPDLTEVREQIGHLEGGNKFLGRKEVKELPNVLWDDEKVEKFIVGTYGGIGTGVLVATNKRLVFVDKGMMKLRVEDFPYDKITSIQYKTGMMMGELTIFASGNKAEIENLDKKQCRNFAETVRARITAASEHASYKEPASQAAAAQPADAGGDVVSQIERLGRLREQGLLTDEEFQAQKEKILAN